MRKVIRINDIDNVCVALADLKKGDIVEVCGDGLTVSEDITKGHKIAVTDIKNGQNVVKYGFPIGHATLDITRGSHVHTHNLSTNLSGIIEYRYEKKLYENPYRDRSLTFKGYKRADGGAGIRNELWIVPTVGCVNAIGERIIERFKSKAGKIYADKINLLKHNYGCSQLGGDLENTRSALCGAVKHPNAGGVLVLSLGCENNTPESFKAMLGDYDTKRIKFLTAQDEGDEIEKGAELLCKINENMKTDKRVDLPFSALKIGLKCGGSDGLSGITANPLLGMFTDFVIAQGGTAVLTEVPEMFGAETLLMERAKSREVFDNIVNLINSFKKYFMESGQPVYENPSPGNKAGGITTLEEKALGCTQKAGKAVVNGVLKYGERIKTSGLSLLYAPGNDMVSASALAASGCQMVLFTTGRGTPYGSIVPTYKISTSTKLFCAKPNWIDFDAGSLAEGGTSANGLLESLISSVLDAANGGCTRNEENGFNEYAIWKSGVTM